MDLLVEKLDGSRYYLSQYKVLITEFEESALETAHSSISETATLILEAGIPIKQSTSPVTTALTT